MMRNSQSFGLRAVALLALLTQAAGCFVADYTYVNTHWKTLSGEEPQVIAHRGDSGNYPEHTLAAYESAMKERADWVEVDIVLTKDDVPICLHDLDLSRTTARTGVTASSLTLAQVKSLGVVQPKGSGRPTAQSRLSVPTLAETIELINRYNSDPDMRRQVGIYIEIKKPGMHRTMGKDPSKAVIDLLAEFEQAGTLPPVILQCFDREETERLAAMSDYPVVWLTDKPVPFGDLPKGIAGLGIEKSVLGVREGEDGYESAVVRSAHAKGLFVHAWTFRDDKLAGTGFDDGEDEIDAYLAAGVDGLFTDFPETGIDARNSVESSWNKASASARTRKSARGRTE